nr:uncharacterized protein LOC120888063 isoform X2 [Ictidomys tridecemlineatus]
MQASVKDKPLDTGPIYFFDQLKPERNKWEKETYEKELSQLMVKYGTSKELKKAELSAVTSSKEKNEFQLISISEPPGVSKLPLNLKFSKTHWQKKLLEEYMLTAPETLSELETILQKYDEHNITFPVGIVSLKNFSWQDLTEGAFECAPKYSMPSQHKTLPGDSSSITMVDSKEQKIISDPREESNKENSLVKAPNDQHMTSFKSMEKNT